MGVHEWNVGWIARKWAAVQPRKTAFIFEDRTITYQALNEGANRVSHCLQEKGIKKGDRVSVLLKTCPEFLEVYFGVAKLGAILVPLNFRLIGAELEFQLNNTDCRLLVFHDVFAEEVDKIRSRIGVEADKYICLKNAIQDGAECPEWAVDYHDLMNGYSSDEPLPDESVEGDHPLAIIYTSGTTGTPKGAVLSHLQTHFKCASNVLTYDMRKDDVWLTTLPLCHSAGLFISATTTLYRGATLVMREKFDARQFAEDIAKYRATIVYAFTTMWKFILEGGMLDKVDKGSARVFLGGGERTPQTLLDELAQRGVVLLQGFGQTESSNMMVLAKYDRGRAAFIPNFFVDAWIENEAGERLPPGEMGEIVTKGPTVMSGYWKLPEENAKTIVGGKLHTGDLAYMDEEGCFYLGDRAKDMYRSGGENVYPAEIEKVLADHPKIFDVAIIGVSDEKWGETGLALVVKNENEMLTDEEVLSYLNGRVARYKIPRYVEFVDELPMTASGRIKKVDLRDKYGVPKREAEAASKNRRAP
ncbi:MAG: Long-chain-fatty-acid--CoA ligase FadD13 [Syntrophorhabdus sp. PtaU1.Bin058]|nr:MAG: Long-chain-fatty-acid--CoA ligase FadD13 [Syntrophorhabdus sp. PtaU1.Bin058]